MSTDDVRPIVIEDLPEADFRVAVGYLDDARRECQLVLVARDQGRATDPVVARVATRLVPAIEAVGDAFLAAEVTSDGVGSLRLRGAMDAEQAAAVAELQVQLVQLRSLVRRGDLLLDSEPAVAALITWLCEEVADQLAGRAPRPYVAAGPRAPDR